MPGAQLARVLVSSSVDWGSFFTGVAVTVVGGLILAAIFGVPGWYRRRRKKNAKEAEARREARAHIRAGVQEITREMRENARLVERLEAGDADSSERRYLSLLQWRNFQEQIAALRAEAPELWRELVGIYADLDMARHGQKLPSSDDLLRLADRLDKAAD
jgi:hypothetical protein